MRVIAKQDTCAGHGQCLLAAPEVFDLPDDVDHVVILDEHPAEALRAQVVRAVGMCPMAALAVIDE